MSMKKEINEPNDELQKQFSGVKTAPKWIVILFFVIGLLSSIAFRAIIVIQRIDAQWVRPVWYFGVTGFVAFFFYSFVVNRKRKKLIAERQLLEKLQTNACLYDEDREAAIYLLKSLDGSLETYNYLSIFVLSIIAIVADLVMTKLGM